MVSEPASSSAPDGDEIAPGPKESFKALGVVAICFFALVGAGWAGVEYWQNRQRMELFDLAIDAMSEHPTVRQKLGLPIQCHLDGLKFPDMETAHVNEGATIRFDVVGPRGSAKAFAFLKLANGTWFVKQFFAEFEDGSSTEFRETGIM